MNLYVDLPIVTGVGTARNLAVVLSADAVIAVDGTYGTLSEIAHALQHGRPVVGIGTWSLAAPGTNDVPIVRAEDPREAVALALAAGGEAARNRSG